MTNTALALALADRDEEEEFYESLDRILSSSCSSTSASDDDADPCRHRRHHHPLLSFPPPSLDIWLSEPAPVQERRRRLLLQMGLASDPVLSRRCPGNPPAPPRPRRQTGRSASCDGICPRPRAHSPIPRSRSDGSVDPTAVNTHPQQPSQLGFPFPPPTSNKPPLVGRFRPHSCSNIDVSDGEEAEAANAGGSGDFSSVDPRCMIRNLDTGKEFVVKEFREDGMWNKLREVGTGRQLTMEEFEMCVGRSPIVQELMRRQIAEDSSNGGKKDGGSNAVGSQRAGASGSVRSKKRGGWLRSIKNVAGTVVGGGNNRDRRSSDEKDTSSEKGGRRSSSATDDSQDGPHPLHDCPQLTKVRQYGKSQKELTCVYMSQEIYAHNGSIWSIKFSLDGQYLASAGEDCVIHIWQVLEKERKGEVVAERVSEDSVNRYSFASQNGSPEPTFGLACVEGGHGEKKRRSKVTGGRKSASSDQVQVPEHLFALSDKPVCTFKGHLDDVLDLSWSKSQYLLSSSMDKTVRLWHMSSNSCLKIFSHSDYVTCIQFNPVDDRFFISGSLDEKVRLWSIPDRQVVDWNDLHEMVTAACFTPDGQGALVGSHKGSCHLYNTFDNKLHQKNQIDLQIKKRKSSSKKITGFQFAPGSSSEVLITSADSRVRVVDGSELVHKFKGFRNTSSQISASLTANRKYVISASEDSNVYVWRYDADSQPRRSKGSVAVTQSYEHFHCQDVTVAIPWPGINITGMLDAHSNKQTQNWLDETQNSVVSLHSRVNDHSHSIECEDHAIIVGEDASHCSDRVSATWPEEKLFMKCSPRSSGDLSNGCIQLQSRSAWGMVIVTAGRGGEIKAFQNFGIAI